MMMVDAKKRAEALEELINEKGGEKYTLNYSEVWRNGQIRPAYILQAEGRNCSPTAYCDDAWYEMDDEAVADYLIKLYEEHAFQLNVDPLLTPEYMEDHVLPRLTPISNIDGLKKSEIVCRQYLNLAVLYYLPVDGFSDDATVQVTEQLLDRVGLSADDVDRFAMRNLASTVDFLSMGRMLAGLLSETGEEMPLPPAEDIGMWVITNDSRCWGAAALLFDSALFNALEEKFGRKIAILPSSIHELIAVPYDHDEQLEDFLSMVKEVNATQVAEEDLLGDCVYYHDGSKVCAFA